MWVSKQNTDNLYMFGGIFCRNKHSEVIPTKCIQSNVHTFYLSTSSSLSNKNILCTPDTNFFFYFYLILIELCQSSPTNKVFYMWSLSLQPPMIHGLPDTLRINPININPNLTTFIVDDPSDNVTLSLCLSLSLSLSLSHAHSHSRSLTLSLLLS